MSTGNLPAVAERPEQHAAPALTGKDAVRHAMSELKAIRTFVSEELKEGLDYGVIPGTGNKPTLYLPGAQKTAMYFNTFPDYSVQAHEMGEGHVEYIVTTRLISRSSGGIVGGGIGSCSTMETKYRFRRGSRRCPKCGSETIMRSKEEYGGGWYCNKKRDGCGAKFPAADPAILSQSEGRAENENIHDVRNTVLKMAKKRSIVDASLGLGCLSELFTQDLEDTFDIGAAPEESPARREPSQAERSSPEPEPPPPNPAKEKALADIAKPIGRLLADLAADDAREFDRACAAEGLELAEGIERPNAHSLARHIAKWCVRVEWLPEGAEKGEQKQVNRTLSDLWDTLDKRERATLRKEAIDDLAAKYKALFDAAESSHGDAWEGPEPDEELKREAQEAAEKN